MDSIARVGVAAARPVGRASDAPAALSLAVLLITRQIARTCCAQSLPSCVSLYVKTARIASEENVVAGSQLDKHHGERDRIVRP